MVSYKNMQQSSVNDEGHPSNLRRRRLYHNKPNQMKLLSPTEWTSQYLTASNGNLTIFNCKQWHRYSMEAMTYRFVVLEIATLVAD